MKVFTTLLEALAQGYHVYDRYKDGYRVRIRYSNGLYAFALAEVTG